MWKLHSLFESYFDAPIVIRECCIFISKRKKNYSVFVHLWMYVWRAVEHTDRSVEKCAPNLKIANPYHYYYVIRFSVLYFVSFVYSFFYIYWFVFFLHLFLSFTFIHAKYVCPFVVCPFLATRCIFIFAYKALLRSRVQATISLPLFFFCVFTTQSWFIIIAFEKFLDFLNDIFRSPFCFHMSNPQYLPISFRFSLSLAHFRFLSLSFSFSLSVSCSLYVDLFSHTSFFILLCESDFFNLSVHISFASVAKIPLRDDEKQFLMWNF